MADVEVSSWVELIDALYDIPQTSLGRYRSSLLYRGVCDSSWSLETSLVRMGPHHRDVEEPLLRSFRKYAEPGSLAADSLWMTLSLAQHHGVPTRLLDWTLAPRVAAHFATSDEQKYDCDGAIWCVDVVRARELLPGRLRDILDRESAFYFSVEMLSGIRSLQELDAYAEEGEFALFFEPPSLDARIINQAAAMSVMPGASLSIARFLEAHPDLWSRVIIPATLKWEVRDKLDQDNVTERMLFPGLDGLARWLKRYYGLGPADRVVAGEGGDVPGEASPGQAEPR
ncbi:FRG domain-containing protein [Motilibacter aurantiacus]|uniref:FRG domain-containing protein n=1 Tax=Motilibacter aurantiacus TaxID=2714955 RepID=UPI0014093FD0|nr:FRG domain-containing protein [Motilibacter aurantiacus]NHC46153.1 FRG domain-containing protein [Motilibacter aurantiacus]